MIWADTFQGVVASVLAVAAGHFIRREDYGWGTTLALWSIINGMWSVA